MAVVVSVEGSVITGGRVSYYVLMTLENGGEPVSRAAVHASLDPPADVTLLLLRALREAEAGAPRQSCFRACQGQACFSCSANRKASTCRFGPEADYRRQAMGLGRLG